MVLYLLCAILLFSGSILEVFFLLSVCGMCGLLLGYSTCPMLGLILGITWAGGLMVLVAYIMTLVGRTGHCNFWLSSSAVIFFFLSLPMQAPASGFSTLVISSSLLLILGSLLLLAMVSVVIVVDIRQGSF